MRTRKPTRVSAVAASAFKAIHAENELSKYAGLPRWKDVIGPDLSLVTHPEKIVRNILYVKVPDTVWAQELTMRKGEILRRLFEKQFGPPLDDIVFLCGDPLDFM